MRQPTYPKCQCMCDTKTGDVLGPKRIEVNRQANLATTKCVNATHVHVWVTATVGEGEE